MKKVAILVGIGDNQFEFPCRIFENMEQGKRFCKELFGNDSGSYEYDCDEAEETVEEDGETPIPALFNKETKIANELFTHWYFGCGGLYDFELREVDFNSKFVGFDLD